ncbi:MAG: cytochrome c [Acidimicrobiia bacterium]
MSRPKKRRPVARPNRPTVPAAQPPQSKRRSISTAMWVVVAVTVVIGTLVGLGLAEKGPVPLQRDPTVVTAGQELFTASCAVCHGADLGGSQTGPPLLVPTYAPNHHGDEAFQRAVASGVPSHHWNFGDMAPVAGLSRDDVSQIVAYVRTMQEAEGIFLDPTH